MKKSIFGLIALATMSLASCSTETKDTTGTASYSVATLVTDMATPDQVPFVAPATYTVYMNWTQWKGSVSTKNQPLKNEAGNSNSLVCDTTAFLYNQLSTDVGYGDVIMFRNLKGDMNGNKELAVMPGSKFVVTSLFYRYNGVVSGVPNMTVNQPAVLMNYYVGNYNVKSIPLDAVYLGTTTTTMGESVPYQNKEIGYRIQLNSKDNKYTAMFVIYNAQFADKMPKLEAIVLKDLPVEFKNGSYSIKAENVVPKMPEAGQLTDNDKYTFESLDISFSGELLNTANIRFDIKGGFKGTFSGSYVNHDILKEPNS